MAKINDLVEMRKRAVKGSLVGWRDIRGQLHRSRVLNFRSHILVLVVDPDGVVAEIRIEQIEEVA